MEELAGEKKPRTKLPPLEVSCRSPEMEELAEMVSDEKDRGVWRAKKRMNRRREKEGREKGDEVLGRAMVAAL